ncbi:hypothetical protein [Streptomyces sp. SBT349]|uniref:hypothetical protein n=1 Tax=Streptomyces sp. SBT349 TaxID=1580539 RepID=UPI00066B84EB|nr:hypothetical protein [Streptomyces sp. SBT349]
MALVFGVLDDDLGRAGRDEFESAAVLIAGVGVLDVWVRDGAPTMPATWSMTSAKLPVPPAVRVIALAPSSVRIGATSSARGWLPRTSWVQWRARLTSSGSSVGITLLRPS